MHHAHRQINLVQVHSETETETEKTMGGWGRELFLWVANRCFHILKCGFLKSSDFPQTSLPRATEIAQSIPLPDASGWRPELIEICGVRLAWVLSSSRNASLESLTCLGLNHQGRCSFQKGNNILLEEARKPCILPHRFRHWLRFISHVYENLLWFAEAHGWE